MKHLTIAGILLLFGSGTAQAEVTNSADNGFTIKHEAVANAPVEEVWSALVQPSRWWNGAHSWSGNAENLYLVAQAGGCFCELIKTDPEENIRTATGSVQHMRVIMVQKNEVLRMSGALGPLQGEALNGTLTIELQSGGDRTGVRFTYKVGGYMELKVDEMAPAVDDVIGEQLTRLSALFAPEPEPKSESENEVEE
ncbi:hypothetical protein MNBD_ALPHA04-1505 [hydrothermal vent metagenome]|uniref:Activator of Hsp90 ATPase homologue 1/2-like C-terminal domain-containing protein n=1 Tax=hydrothermal vent metagenome TaxID=652676 RepID=A0A3B0T4U1_9ZZZZ